MAWTNASTDALTLTGTMQILEASAVDLTVTMLPGEVCHVQFKFDPQTTPTEFLEWDIITSADNSTWDTVPYDAGTLGNSVDPAYVSVVVKDVRYFQMRGRLIDTDGTDGGDDTTSTLTATYALDGVDLAPSS